MGLLPKSKQSRLNRYSVVLVINYESYNGHDLNEHRHTSVKRVTFMYSLGSPAGNLEPIPGGVE